MSTRFYSPDPAQNGKLWLAAEEARHLSRVCRLGVGDVVEVFDGKGHATKAEIIKVEHGRVELIAIGPPFAGRFAPFSLTLASAVPKGDRFDWLVEKATELGVERLIPLVTERSVVEPGGPKLERLRRAIIEASKQCGRNQLMILDTPMRWDQLVGLYSDSIRFLADPAGVASPQWPAIALGQLRDLGGRSGRRVHAAGKNDGRPEGVARDPREFQHVANRDRRTGWLRGLARPRSRRPLQTVH